MPAQAGRRYAFFGAVAHLVERLVRNEEVEGSSPFRSTSLRPQPREGEGCPAVGHDAPAWRRRTRLRDYGLACLHYIVSLLLVSEKDATRHYTGCTIDLKARLAKHNAGEVPHTSKNRPWMVETAVAFRSREKARAFEHYLKTGSGREFARRHP